MAQSQVVLDLKAARDLIKDPAHWIQYRLASDMWGETVIPTHPDAVSWCAEGALNKVCAGRSAGWVATSNMLNAALPCGFPYGYTIYNDQRSHSAVMRLFTKAIKLAESESK